MNITINKKTFLQEVKFYENFNEIKNSLKRSEDDNMLSLIKNRLRGGGVFRIHNNLWVHQDTEGNVIRQGRTDEDLNNYLLDNDFSHVDDALNKLIKASDDIGITLEEALERIGKTSN